MTRFLNFLGISTALHAALCGETKAASNLEQFKDFIANPPPFAEVVYSSLQAHSGTNNIHRTFHARWQTNAFYLRQINQVSDITNVSLSETLVSKSDVGCWFLKHDTGYFYWDGNRQETNDVENGVRIGIE